MSGPIAIAVSGGVDSLVSAYLLKQQQSDVFGIHFLTGYEKPTESGIEGLKAMGRQLDLPVVVVDLKAQFKTMVVDYFTAAYRNGKTPNPCLVCNPAIKFGALLDEARQLGASRLATGHYARVEGGQGTRYRLRRGVDEIKDQSYFLSRLTQDQLMGACFPLGTLTKAKVKALAAAKGLQPLTRQESQDVCFIRDTGYADFLIRTTGIRPQPGDIVDTAGHRVGTHSGLHRYTVGQRRGINCPASAGLLRGPARHPAQPPGGWVQGRTGRRQLPGRGHQLDRRCSRWPHASRYTHTLPPQGRARDGLAGWSRRRRGSVRSAPDRRHAGAGGGFLSGG